MRDSLLKKLLLLLALVGAMPAALACSCIGFSAEGFIHPDVTALPGNAKGAVFLAPSDVALTPAMFSATSPSATAALNVRIEPVLLPPDHPMRARLQDRDRLFRIGVEGGFVAGAHYTIRIDGQASFNVRHAGVSFDIDPAPLDLAPSRFAVRLDGPARRTMLALEDGGGACGTTEAALVQDFHVQIPEALQRYLPALGLFDEERDAVPGAAFAPVQYRASVCTPRLLDGSALPDRRDLVHRACRSAANRIHIRSRVGMLEVDELVVPADGASAELTALKSLSCSPYGMLREAIERGDTADVAHLACELGRAGDIQLESLDLGREPVPAPGQWEALVHGADSPVAACGIAAMSRMLIMSKPGHPEFLGAYLALAKEGLRSYDQAMVAATLLQLSELRRAMRDASPSAARPRDAFLLLLPELLTVAESGAADAGNALELIGSVGAGARGAVARLTRLAEQDRPEAAGAVRALANIVPADPAFQQSLLRWARRSALGDTPALAFARVAGKTRPQEAVALLLPLAQADDVYAIDALAGLGDEAAPATGLLLAKVAHASDSYKEGRALRAAILTGPDEKPVADALVRALLASLNPNLHSSDYIAIARYRAHAADFVPVIEHLIAALRWDGQKKDLRELVGAMALSASEKQALLDKLVQAPAPH